MAPEAPVMYYVDHDATGLGVGGGPVGAPALPWYVQAQIGRAQSQITVGIAQLTGRSERLFLSWRGTRYDLGSAAVFYPSYRGRGETMVRPLKELLVFFLILFAACGGIVAFTVAQFMAPIKRLEQRADAMARGELADPVAAGGEGDEIGRLTLALEEMRRALRDKLRSTEEVNLDLERAVQMRTADLARKNRELAETLDKLTRAQKQLVQSEKLASIGQLVAGIAHEINNPVNAIVNTVAGRSASPLPLSCASNAGSFTVELVSAPSVITTAARMRCADARRRASSSSNALSVAEYSAVSPPADTPSMRDSSSAFFAPTSTGPYGG